MLKDIIKIDLIPEYIKFSFSAEQEVSRICAYLTIRRIYGEYCGGEYMSKRDSLMEIYIKFSGTLRLEKMDETVNQFYYNWQTANLNKMLKDLKGSYDFIPLQAVEDLLMEFEEMFKSKKNIILPEKAITLECFSNLRKYFEPESEKLFNYLMDSLKDAPISSEQEKYKKAYSTVDFLIRESKNLFEQHADLFTPISKLKVKLSMVPKRPIVRRIKGEIYNYFVTKEIETAMKTLKKKPESVIKVESEEERKLGIVFATQTIEYYTILATLHVSPQDLIIIEVDTNCDYRDISFPIISSFGTHCIPAYDVFDTIIYYLSVVLKVFQRCNRENLEKVLEWVSKMVDDVFVERSVMYLIETWKIDEIIDRARQELSGFLTEPDYEVPSQKSYNKNDIFRELEKLTRNLDWEKRCFMEAADQTINLVMIHEPIHIKHVYNGYSQMIRVFLKEHNQKIESFIQNQKEYSPVRVSPFAAIMRTVEASWKNHRNNLYASFGLGDARESDDEEESENSEIQKKNSEIQKEKNDGEEPKLAENAEKKVQESNHTRKSENAENTESAGNAGNSDNADADITESAENDETSENAATAENDKNAENAENSGNADIAETVEKPESADNDGNTANVENAENAENTENSGNVDSAETAENLESAENAEISENTESVGNSGNAENSENAENTENSENAENYENSENVENTENSENAENTENSENVDSAETAGNAENAENIGHAGNSENPENTEIQKLREELARSRKSEAELLEKLKIQNSQNENQIQKLRKKLEKSENSKTEMEQQLKLVNSKHEEQLQKHQDELEKSQKENIELKENLKRKKCEVQQLQWDIQKKDELQKNTSNLEKDRQELKLKMEFLMSENDELRVNFFKNTEFQQKIKELSKTLKKEHCELVDMAWPRLHRLCSKYPDSEDVREAKNDLKKLEDYPYEFVENVKQEYKKLRE